MLTWTLRSIQNERNGPTDEDAENLFRAGAGGGFADRRECAYLNLWFIRDGMIEASERRSYHEDIDWVCHQAGVAVSPEEVEAAVAAMRRGAINFRDTVPPKKPALKSPCNF